MLLLGLDFGGVLFPWDSTKVVALLVVGSIMIFAFIYSEARVAKYPLIPMSLFKNRTNIATFAVAFFHGFVSLLFSMSLVTPHADSIGFHKWRILHAFVFPIGS